MKPAPIPFYRQPLSPAELDELRKRRQNIPEFLLRLNCDVERLIATVDQRDRLIAHYQIRERRLVASLEFAGVPIEQIEQFVDDANTAIEQTTRLLRSTLNNGRRPDKKPKGGYK